MELVDRYLHAVRFWLPAKQREDILAELSEDLRAEIGERESELGRPLDKTEVAAILKPRGRPLLVANRYLPQQYLIGPLLFPVYLFVLKVVALCYVIPVLLVSTGLMTLDPAYRAAHAPAGWIEAIGKVWGPFWGAAFFSFAVVTVVFAAIERAHAKSGFLEDWDPGKLPAVRDPNRISRGESVLELVANLVFCIWWIGLRSPAISWPSAVHITLAPVWPYFFWGYLAIGITNIAGSAVKLLQPYWTPFRAGFRLASDIVGTALFCWLCRAQIVSGLAISGVSPEDAARIANAVNLWMSRGLPLVLIVGVITAAADLRRLFRAWSNSATLKAGAGGGVSASVLT